MTMINFTTASRFRVDETELSTSFHEVDPFEGAERHFDFDAERDEALEAFVADLQARAAAGEIDLRVEVAKASARITARLLDADRQVRIDEAFRDQAAATIAAFDAHFDAGRFDAALTATGTKRRRVKAGVAKSAADGQRR